MDRDLGQQDNTEQTNTTTIDPTIVNEARGMGWVDQSEWRGNPEHWRDANEYVRRGQEVLPIVRAQLEREKTERAKEREESERKSREFEDRVRRQEESARTLQERMEAQQHEFAERTERNDKMARVALERQRQTFLEQIDAAKFQAVANADQQGYAGLIERERQFYRETKAEDEQYAPKPVERAAPQQNAQPQNQGLTSRDQRVRDEWIDKNPWFLRSPELNTEAQKIHVELWDKHPGLDLSDNLDRVTSELRKRHPEKFGISQAQESRQEDRQQNAFSGSGSQEQTQNSGETASKSSAQHSFVEGGNTGPASGSSNSSYRRKGWADIHPDDRSLAEKSYIQTGFYGSDNQKARDEYAKDYWEINGE